MNKTQINDLLIALLLLYIYWLQGTISGFFTYTLPILFAERQVSIPELALFSFANYPYTFKVLFAPFVDSYYLASFGKRKTYIVPIQYTIATLFVVGAFFIE